MTKTPNNNDLIIYQSESGALELKYDNAKETILANLNQIAKLFERDKSVISRHIKNIFEIRELQVESVVAFFATTGTDNKKIMQKNMDTNLEIVKQFAKSWLSIDNFDKNKVIELIINVMKWYYAK